MLHILVSDDTENLGHVMLLLSENGPTVTYRASTSDGAGEPIPFTVTSRALANHLFLRSPSRLHFAILGRSASRITLRRDDLDGASIWLWHVDGAEHAAPDLPTAISEVLIWLARNGERPQTGDLPDPSALRAPTT
jgi:hypothetical protein